MTAAFTTWTPVFFNLGVLHEAVGNYKLAQEKYATAAKLKSKENKYTKAQTRAAFVAGWTVDTQSHTVGSVGKMDGSGF